MLTKNNCPKCVGLKNYLEFGLRNKYQDNIEILKLEDNEELFMEYAKKFDILATPALIANDSVLTDSSPLKVNEFLEKNI